MASASGQKDISKRLRSLDERIRIKFSQCFKEVRLAFLERDRDQDGYLTVQEILEFFERENEVVDREDLEKLFKLKSGQHSQGRMSYAEFCSWLGHSIHQGEGLYFRHDSSINFEQEQYM